MPRQKYNWTVLKEEFLKSEHTEVKSFLSSKNMPYNRFTREKAKWWAKEKQANANKVLAKATEKAINKQADALEIPMEELSIAKKNAVIKVINMMMDEKNPLDVADIERVVKIIRTEMGLPNTYSKNENLNMEKFEWIHIIWKWSEEE